MSLLEGSHEMYWDMPLMFGYEIPMGEYGALWVAGGAGREHNLY